MKSPSLVVPLLAIVLAAVPSAACSSAEVAEPESSQAASTKDVQTWTIDKKKASLRAPKNWALRVSTDPVEPDGMTKTFGSRMPQRGRIAVTGWGSGHEYALLDYDRSGSEVWSTLPTLKNVHGFTWLSSVETVSFQNQDRLNCDEWPARGKNAVVNLDPGFISESLKELEYDFPPMSEWIETQLTARKITIEAEIYTPDGLRTYYSLEPRMNGALKIVDGEGNPKLEWTLRIVDVFCYQAAGAALFDRFGG